MAKKPLGGGLSLLIAVHFGSLVNIFYFNLLHKTRIDAIIRPASSVFELVRQSYDFGTIPVPGTIENHKIFNRR